MLLNKQKNEELGSLVPGNLIKEIFDDQLAFNAESTKFIL